MIAWQDVTVRHGARATVDRVSLTVAPGERVAIVGPNGAGKTSLLRAALALLRPAEGAVQVDGSDTLALDARARAARVAWLPQTLRRAEPIPVRVAVAAARFRFDESRSARDAAVLAALTAAGVAHLAERSVSSLSGGEAQRVALAGLVAQDAATWLLDEPGNHLDPAVQRSTFSFLAAAADAGRTLIVVTHDVELLGWLAAPGQADRVRVVGMKAGAVSLDVRLDDPTLPESMSTLLGVRVHRLELDGRTQLVLGAALA